MLNSAITSPAGSVGGGAPVSGAGLLVRLICPFTLTSPNLAVSWALPTPTTSIVPSTTLAIVLSDDTKSR